MKATEARLLEFLKKSPQFVIPIYQRTYSWTERECRQLWDDILRTGSNDAIAAHFVGSIVYIEKGLYQVSGPSPMLVIDGQQRLTTVMLILEALARHLGDDEPVDGFSAKKLRSCYLLNTLEEGERGFKLLLTQTDRASLLALVQQKAPPTECSLRIDENFAFFEEQVKALKTRLAALCKGLAKLVIVDISLSRDQDNPQLIFESMNSTGRELSQADLIEAAAEVWAPPALPAEVLETYRPRAERPGGYTIDDHPYLSVGSVRSLFEAFRKEVLALDPCVSEEFLKIYVAYKAETNFVDVVPQAKRLRLSMNMPFHELHDPRGMAKDVTHVGRWGNGDVEVGLGSAEELPYVMGLVRQAFEKQMGNGEADA